MPLINICILTRQRPELLRECLRHTTEIAPPDNCEINISVIENDTEAHSKKTVEQIAEDTPIKIHYLLEPKRGIPVARNSAMRLSESINADYIAFIDDDEWPDKNWIKSAYDYCQSQGGDIVVSGNVVSQFPENTPDHIRELLQRKLRPTGEEPNSCATNNVLFPIQLASVLKLQFDESNPLAGGTDTLFFAEAKARGVRVVKCAESIVFEKIPENRTSFTWISKRKYRAGITEYRRKRLAGSPAIKIVLSNLLTLLINALAVPLVSLTGNKRNQYRKWLKACKAAGTLSGVFGVQVQSYKTIDG